MIELLSNLFGSEAVRTDELGLFELGSVRMQLIDRAIATAEIALSGFTDEAPVVVAEQVKPYAPQMTQDEFMRNTTPYIPEDENPITANLERIRKEIEAAREAA